MLAKLKDQPPINISDVKDIRKKDFPTNSNNKFCIKFIYNTMNAVLWGFEEQEQRDLVFKRLENKYVTYFDENN